MNLKHHSIVIAEEENLDRQRVESAIRLLDQGNTIPFIARYRKEATGSLDEQQLRKIEDRLEYLRKLEERKQEVIRLIEEQDKLTGELKTKIEQASLLQEVEDLYRPYRQKRRTRATRAREKGLEPLAEIMLGQELTSGDREEITAPYLDPEQDLESIEDVLQGARDIIAELISDRADLRQRIRSLTYKQALLVSSVKDEEQDERGKYEQYYDYREAVSKIPPHRILALNRGEQEEVLQIKVEAPETGIVDFLREELITGDSLFKKQLELAIEDSYKRLIAPSIAREVRNSLTERAEEHAIQIFGKNLRSLLLQPPLRDTVVMGIDPGFRTGCKVCVVEETGKLVKTATIYPHPPQSRIAEAGDRVREMINDHNVRAIAIGNGTAARETEFFIADLLDGDSGTSYTIVDEAGASVYSASATAREEFPELDVSMRGAVSIARRLQDPLAELVKINPRSIGVGLYQHDVDAKKLEQSLATVVESVVNYVGVDINTASSSLLQYVAGINSGVAENLINYRNEQGRFTDRFQLKEVYGVGPKTFTQAAGFIRIFNGDSPLATTPIHPESYSETKSLIEGLGFSVSALADEDKLNRLRQELDNLNPVEKAKELELGVPTLKDIIEALKRPGLDPRSGLAGPIFRTDVLKLEDLKQGMELQGTVRNVVDFGAFVDIGVKEDGLVHVSELSYKYIEDPMEVVEVGDVVRVKIVSVDPERKRISLSMKV